MDGGSRHLRRGSSSALLVGLLLAGTFAGASPARAGGWWNSLDTGAPMWAPAMRVKVSGGHALFQSIEGAERAYRNGSFYAYLLGDFDYDIVNRALDEDFRPGWWELGGATATRLGPVALKAPEANLVRASAHVTVPDVEPGRYEVMFCTAGCRRSFADVIPTTVTV